MVAALLAFGVVFGVLGSAWAYTVTGSLLLAFLAYVGAGAAVLIAGLLSALMFPETVDERLAEDPLLLVND